MKVLHADRNKYYGGSSASIGLKEIFEKVERDKKDLSVEVYGVLREYNIDLIPKLIMGNGLLVRLLLHCDVAKYLEFKVIDGSFVFSGSRPHKVRPLSHAHSPECPLLPCIYRVVFVLRKGSCHKS